MSKKILCLLIFLNGFALATQAAQVVQPHVAGAENQKYSAGDWVVFELDQPHECKDCVPQMYLELEKGPVKWGNGRILSFETLKEHSLKVVLTSYEAGNFEIPAIPFIERGANPSDVIFETEPVSVRFEKVEGDKSKDTLYGPAQMQLPRWIVESSIAGVVLLAALLFWILRKRLSKTKAPETKTPQTPLEEFVEIKGRLLSAGLIESSEYKKLYFGLSEAVKKFLAKSYNIAAEDKTTSELIELMSEYKAVSIFTEQTIGQWQRILNEMDVVKFTDYTPSKDQAREIIAQLTNQVATAWRLSPLYKENAKPISKYVPS